MFDVAGGDAHGQQDCGTRAIAERVAASSWRGSARRELEVFRLLATGKTNGEIAAELIVGETTVKIHVTRILMKLGVRDRVQAVVLAYETGIVQPNAGASAVT